MRKTFTLSLTAIILSISLYAQYLAADNHRFKIISFLPATDDSETIQEIDYNYEPPFVNDYERYIIVPKKIIVADSVKLAPILERLDLLLSGEKIELTQMTNNNSSFDEQMERNNSLLREIKSILNIENSTADMVTKIKDKEKKERLAEIIGSYEFYESRRPIDEKILKEIKKGKISDEVWDEIYRVIQDLNNSNKRISNEKALAKNKVKANIEILKQTIDNINEAINNGLENQRYHGDYIYYIRDEFGLDLPYELPETTAVRDVKIKNKYRRDIDPSTDYRKNSYIDSKAQKTGWEWLDEESAYTTKNEHYPVTITYRVYDSHPEYHVTDEAVFDTNGKLLRIRELTDKAKGGDKIIKNFEIGAEAFLYKLMAEDYQNNKYNIKNESHDVRYAVENLLLISDDFKKAEEKRLAPMRRELDNALKSGNVRKFKQLYEKFSEIALAPKPNDPNDNRKAKAYIQQLRDDHDKDILRLWKIERVDDLTFNIIYLNKANNEIRVLPFSLKPGAKPYSVEAGNVDAQKTKDSFMAKPFDPTPYLEGREDLKRGEKESIRGKKDLNSSFEPKK